MLDQSTRRSILDLRARGLGIRRIARLLDISRNTVREVLQRAASVTSLVCLAPRKPRASVNTFSSSTPAVPET
jgi:IS30 family transposase